METSPVCPKGIDAAFSSCQTQTLAVNSKREVGEIMECMVTWGELRTALGNSNIKGQH